VAHPSAPDEPDEPDEPTAERPVALPGHLTPTHQTPAHQTPTHQTPAHQNPTRQAAPQQPAGHHTPGPPTRGPLPTASFTYTRPAETSAQASRAAQPNATSARSSQQSVPGARAPLSPALPPPPPDDIDDDAIPEDALEFNPAAADVNQVFVEAPPNPEWTAATGTFKAIVLQSEAAAEAPAQTASKPRVPEPPAARAMFSSDEPEEIELDADFLSSTAEMRRLQLGLNEPDEDMEADAGSKADAGPSAASSIRSPTGASASPYSPAAKAGPGAHAGDTYPRTPTSADAPSRAQPHAPGNVTSRAQPHAPVDVTSRSQPRAPGEVTSRAQPHGTADAHGRSPDVPRSTSHPRADATDRAQSHGHGPADTMSRSALHPSSGDTMSRAAPYPSPSDTSSRGAPHPSPSDTISRAAPHLSPSDTQQRPRLTQPDTQGSRARSSGDTQSQPQPRFSQPSADSNAFPEPDVVSRVPPRKTIRAFGLDSVEPPPEQLASLARSRIAPSAMELERPRRAISRFLNTSSPTAWTVGAGTLLLLLLIQLVNHYRNELAATKQFNKPITALYSALGVHLTPSWDLHAYDVRQLGASVDAESAGQIMVRASVKNSGHQAQPMPLLRVTLQDRFGNRIAARDVPPGNYLPPAIPSTAFLSAGQRIDAEMAFVDPGANAVGFEIDACLPAPAGGIACANDSVSR
jgi:uncharacterized protein DUF3426